MVYGGLQNTPFVNPRKNSVIPKPFQSVSKTQSSKALKAKMGVGKPKRRPQHNVSVTRAPPYKVATELEPLKSKMGENPSDRQSVTQHTRRQGSPDVVKYGSELESLKAKWGKESEPFATTKCHSHTRGGRAPPQYKCWNTDLNNRPKEKRKKKGATQTTKVVA